MSFTNIININNGLPQFILETDETNFNYYFELDENRKFKRSLMYNSEFYYDSGFVSSLEETNVNIETIVPAHKNDSYKGCTNQR